MHKPQRLKHNINSRHNSFSNFVLNCFLHCILQSSCNNYHIITKQKMGKKKRLANDKTQQESFVNMAIKESIICSTQKTQDKQNVRAKINRNI